MLPQEETRAEASFPTVGRWLVTSLPSGWIYVAGFGIRQMPVNSQNSQNPPDAQVLPANISVGQDQLAGPDEFGAYVANQSRLIHHHLVNPAIAGPQPTAFAGAEEALLFFVRHTSRNGFSMLHAQTYVRCGAWVGIVTLTTQESQLMAVRPDYELFLKGLRINAV